MSTWTSRLGGLALVAGLSGCVAGGGALAPAADPPPSRMAVAGGSVIVAGPKGFCIDRGASRDRRGESALTVLSPCGGLGGGLLAPRPRHPAVLTAAVAGGAGLLPVAVPAPDLAGFFRSDRGRAALSRSGKGDTVTVLETLAADGAFLLHLSDTAPFSWGAVQPTYWRALLSVDGRMVTLSVLGLPDSPLGRDDGLALLRDFVTALRESTARGLPKPG
jgi:hypothetical protein